MSKVSVDTRVPTLYDRGKLVELLREIQTQINAVSEEGISAFYRAGTAAPTAGSYSQGDYLRNSAPSELGSGGSKYVIKGWICVASGTPGTWKECRALTGN